MEAILLITTALALIGAYLNSHGYKLSFLIWMATNTIFALHNWQIGEWQQATLFFAYFMISLNGLMYFKSQPCKADLH
jgi:hypothetical protein